MKNTLRNTTIGFASILFLGALPFQGNAQFFMEDFGTGLATNTLPGGATTNFSTIGSGDNCPLYNVLNDGRYLILPNGSQSHENQVGCLQPNTFFFPGWYTNMTDHTGNTNGRFLLANGNSTSSSHLIAYQRTVPDITAGNSYEFSAYIANILRGGGCSLYSVTEQPVNLSFEVYSGSSASGTPIALLETKDIVGFNTYAPVFVAAPNNPTAEQLQSLWQKASLNFTATSNTLTLVIRDMGGNGCGNDFGIDDISFTSETSVSIAEKRQTLSVYIHPNPAENGNFTLTYSAMQETTTPLNVYDMYGRIVYQQLITLTQGQNNINLQTNLPAGIYTLRSKALALTQPLVIQ